MKPSLTISELISSAKEFCDIETGKWRKEYYGVTDGKAIGTIVEHLFKDYLNQRFDLEIGNSASGIDLPSVNTDIKVTSVHQPQSSCPFKDSKQKIYGLGYNLILFVYQKKDNSARKKGSLEFTSCCFIDSSKTADYQTTLGIHQIIENNGNADDIFAFLSDRHLPGDEITIMQIAKEILNKPPEIGYLTISNALQWRLQYGRIVNLRDDVDGIYKIVKHENEG